MKFQKVFINFLFSVFLLIFSACTKEEIVEKKIEIKSTDSLLLYGTSDFTFNNYTPLNNKPVKVYFHIPPYSNKNTPILFVFHGDERDALTCRNALIGSSNELNFIIIAPEFSEQYFSGGDSYNLGNIFVDGDNPSTLTLNAENTWTFSIIEPIFDYFKGKAGSLASNYDIFGHSAGAQFVHRYLQFKPTAKINKAVISAAGWYTMFDKTVDFPYGIKKSPVEQYDFRGTFSKKIFVIVGGNDNNPNAASLRRNEIVDKQGLNRLDRAQYFYTQIRNTALITNATFNWTYSVLPKVGHDFVATSAAGVSLLYK
jgi:hypothetical protein